MKNFLWKGAAALMMAVAVSACSGDDEVMDQPAGGGEATEEQTPTLTIVATQGDADTRLAFVEGSEKELTWTPGDQIFVTEAETPTNYVTLDLQETEATKTGTFSTTATLPDTWVAGETELVAYYKANENMQNWAFFITRYGSPVQTANDNMDHLLECNYMKSGEFTYSSSAASSLKFKQQGAIMKFVLGGLGGKTITKLLLYAGDNVFTSYEYINSSGNYTKTSNYQMSLSLGTSGSGITVADGGTLTAYLAMGATEATKDVSMTLYALATDGTYYSASVTGGTIAAAKIYTLTKTMEEKTFFCGGAGTEDDPYQIASETELKAFAEWVNINDGARNTYFKQTADITLSSTENWTPIKDFYGTFDGGNLTISGLAYDGNGEGGLFNRMYGAVQNVNLTNVSLKTTGYYCGGIAASNPGTITHCSVSGTVEGETAGGIVGTNEGGTIVACHNSATVSGSNQIGGIAGWITSVAAIIGCYNTGAVGSTGQYSILGGISGVGSTSGSITACYSTGTVTGNYYNGGILGRNNNDVITLSTCYWSGSLSAGVGDGSSEGTTQVTDGNWSTATEAMNTALSTAGYSWVFVENSEETTKDNEPLKLQAVTAE